MASAECVSVGSPVREVVSQYSTILDFDVLSDAKLKHLHLVLDAQYVDGNWVCFFLTTNVDMCD